MRQLLEAMGTPTCPGCGCYEGQIMVKWSRTGYKRKIPDPEAYERWKACGKCTIGFNSRTNTDSCKLLPQDLP